MRDTNKTKILLSRFCVLHHNSTLQVGCGIKFYAGTINKIRNKREPIFLSCSSFKGSNFVGKGGSNTRRREHFPPGMVDAAGKGEGGVGNPPSPPHPHNIPNSPQKDSLNMRKQCAGPGGGVQDPRVYVT